VNRGGQTLEPQRHIAAPSGVPGFLAVLLVAAPVLAATNVAVFNFQMKSDTPDWKWLEKGLSDRIATDFVQDRSLTVVARDEMQMLAQKMNWVPEMATSDPARMKEIRAGLKVEHLVTGVYEVAREQIKITGQIVEVEGRTELARQEISGPVVEVLELQRRLSAELLAWFSKQPPAFRPPRPCTKGWTFTIRAATPRRGSGSARRPAPTRRTWRPSTSSARCITS